MRCAKCGREHDIFEIQPMFAKPVGYFMIPEAERSGRIDMGDDWCVTWNADGTGREYFLRATLPFTVRGTARAIAWGVWVQVEAHVFALVQNLWESEEQALEKPLPARLANTPTGDETTLDLPGSIHMTGPRSIPAFRFAAHANHPLAEEQREGVWPERALEWASPFLHGA